MSPIIASTQDLPELNEARIASIGDLRKPQGDPPKTPEDWARFTAGADALIITGAQALTPDVIEALSSSIKIVATFSVGYEHIDLQAAHARGLPVSNTPDVLTDATADIALLLMLAASRRAHEGQTTIYQDRWTGWSPTQLLGRQLGGKTIGIVGMGRIGLATAHRAKAFGMSIAYHNRSRHADAPSDFDYKESLEDLLSVAEVLSLHCPLTPQTKGLLSEDRIARLPERSIIVNTARGGLVDDDALIGALKSGHVFAAGLDVFEGEPNLDPRYKDLPNVFLLPHLGSATEETRAAMGNCCLDNIEAALGGRPLLTPVGLPT